MTVDGGGGGCRRRWWFDFRENEEGLFSILWIDFGIEIYQKLKGFL